jgi:thiol-disulfide isomerase/thioredoxin
LVSLLLVNCGADNKKAEELAKEFATFQDTLKQKAKTINSRETYKAFMDEKTKLAEDLLKKVETAGKHDTVTLIHGRLLHELKKNDEALAKFNALIDKKADNANDAKFGKVLVLMQTRKDDEALTLFKEIKDLVKKDDNYYEVLTNFAYGAKDPDLRAAYGNEFIQFASGKEEYARFIGYMYENLADIEKEKGNTDKAAEILEKAISETKDPNGKRSLESALKQLKLINTAAPEIEAEQWDNSEALTLAKLKGKAVIIDFWAPWCGPCRKVIPTLAKSYNELKEQGLVVIGFTKIYGRYSDDTQNKGQVDRDEESTLIKDYVKRKEIPYPIAIADKGTSFDAYGVTGIPTMVMIDKEGNIRDIVVGAGDESKLEAKIKNLLK